MARASVLVAINAHRRTKVVAVALSVLGGHGGAGNSQRVR
eukprot:CAMPEP_0119316470 /NCGR_PEP_ID=MMETSP1333-20130426/39709_1 /TAXON_ID=418940 /ORGANISM="Scyphosphaera apsteinii, Strain RCC1455" /LENGTH=39 /DNA_ID= /DNA_START= /DNA_END= /DNA_ORIENTATION=